MAQASVIILNYNGVHFLEKFLPSVVSCSQGHRVIVADNGSTDPSISFLKAHYPMVEIMLFEQNYGFAKGYNETLKHIDTPYSILLNSDVEVTPDWIEPVLAMMEENPNIVACQPKIRSYYQKEYFEHAGAAGGYIG
jgi:GT2 family glycosyltransferase